jgi:hypothetical protein
MFKLFSNLRIQHIVLAREVMLDHVTMLRILGRAASEVLPERLLSRHWRYGGGRFAVGAGELLADSHELVAVSVQLTQLPPQVVRSVNVVGNGALVCRNLVVNLLQQGVTSRRGRL